MGQRLVLEVFEGDERIASAYFHWSGYTQSTYQEIAKLIRILDGKDVYGEKFHVDFEKHAISYEKIHLKPEDYQADDVRLRMIRAYEGLGGGLGREDAEYAKRIFPGETFSENVDRTYGLVFLSEEEMKTSFDWAEAYARINLKERVVSEVDCWLYTPEEEIRKGAVIVKSKEDLFDFPFEKAEEISKQVCGLLKCGSPYVENTDGDVFAAIA